MDGLHAGLVVRKATLLKGPLLAVITTVSISSLVSGPSDLEQCINSLVSYYKILPLRLPEM